MLTDVDYRPSLQSSNFMVNFIEFFSRLDGRLGNGLSNLTRKSATKCVMKPAKKLTMK